MQVLVTGGAGFIGSTLVDRLLREGHKVDVVDNLSSGSLDNLTMARKYDALNFKLLDIRSSELVDLIATNRVEVVFHLAAQASVVASIERPAQDADVNVIGSLRVLDAARFGGARKVVFAASGGTLYGDIPVSQLPAHENLPHRPTSPYGLSKMVVLEYLSMYRALYDLDFTALALANVYGPRQDPHGEAGVVAIFADLMANGQVPTIFGDGEQTRDFVYVDDVVDAFIRSTDQAGSSSVLNVGTGVETSVNMVLKHLSDTFGVLLDANYAPAREGEVRRSALAPTQAREILGWSASTSIATGIHRIVEARFPGSAL